METIQDYLQNFKVEKTDRNRRRTLLKEIYSLYTSTTQRNKRKKANWLRYCKWCRDNKIPDTKENQEKFKKTKTFIQEYKPGTFAYFMSPIKDIDDLEYIISIGKDMDRRNENFSGYLMANLFNKVKTFKQNEEKKIY